MMEAEFHIQDIYSAHRLAIVVPETSTKSRGRALLCAAPHLTFHQTVTLENNDICYINSSRPSSVQAIPLKPQVSTITLFQSTTTGMHIKTVATIAIGLVPVVWAGCIQRDEDGIKMDCYWYGNGPDCGRVPYQIGDRSRENGVLWQWTKENDIVDLCFPDEDSDEDLGNPISDECCEAYPRGDDCDTGYRRLWCYRAYQVIFP